MKFTGSCRFCGQIANVGYSFSTQEEADEYATEHCSCTEAVIQRESREQIGYAKERVKQLFGADAKENGFSPVKEDAVISILNSIVESVANKKLNWATLRIKGGGKATITATANGRIRVQRSVTHACHFDD